MKPFIYMFNIEIKNMTLSGKGDQYWLTNDYEDKRKKALEDRSKYDNTRLKSIDVLDNETLGTGKTDEDTFQFDQYPYPMDQSIKQRKTLDLRDDPKTGGND